jgi:CRP-like cAMP-binding protein
MKPDRLELLPQFVDLFLNTIQASEEEFETVLSYFRKENLPRKFFLLKEGQTCKMITYINKGCVRTYTIDGNGGEHILHFAFEDWFIGDLESLYTGMPTQLNIQALEDCELLCVSKEDFDKLEEQIPRLKEWNVAKQRKAHHAAIKRLSEVKTLSTKERYMNLIEKHPHIFQRVPLQYIASYLDIEPQSLSRLRKKLSENN